jgi:hypothetical protein
MKISYAITVKDEFVEIQKLVNFLRENKRQQDEIVILYDQKNGNEEIATWLTKQNKYPNVQFWRGFFDGHFADWKNKLTEYCDGDYIFQIDADEMPHKSLIEKLPILLEHNSAVELYAIPRVNTVEGLTQEHVQKWGWRVDEKNWVNWPDFQTRLFKNSPEIRWHNKVHEVVKGHKQFAYLPMEEEWALYHPKDIKRQEKQNAYYDTLNG